MAHNLFLSFFVLFHFADSQIFFISIALNIICSLQCRAFELSGIQIRAIATGVDLERRNRGSCGARLFFYAPHVPKTPVPGATRLILPPAFHTRWGRGGFVGNLRCHNERAGRLHHGSLDAHVPKVARLPGNALAAGFINVATLDARGSLEDT